MESLIHHFKLVTEGYRVAPGEVYYAIESPRGELGCFVLADGSSKPARVHFRDPSFVNLQAFRDMSVGGYVADMIASLGMLDPILGRGRPVSDRRSAAGAAIADLPVDLRAVSEGRVPDRAPEGIPELHEVDCPPELREQIEELMGRYPDRKSASIPALWAVQRLYGWCTPEGIRQAAAVMRVTPAYLESVASFYDLLHTEPVGTHKVAVCTNISCWMRGGDELLDAFRAAAEGEEDVFVTGFECLGACDIAPMASIDERYFGPLEAGEAATAIEQLPAGDEVLPEKALEKRPLAGDTPARGTAPTLDA